ncbi:hypothetical protein NONI108955_41050 [Nocardia ninae]|uniref:Uncharacterized protein n=1 Tax=Nocardia ninae NBRC 108245 TaxID=1210091 RepID=A0A511MEM5_9NOCA|nr:hypothetical protein [Nocardia ninae]GEM39029.1 hypothetical protein NN4_35480 [Nocardia ninae NBRC 108245]
MTEQEPRSEFVESTTTRILRRAAKYADETYRDSAPGEYALLDGLNADVEAVLGRYHPPSPWRRGDSLVFAHLYADVPDTTASTDEDGRAVVDVIAALLAAEVEFRGPLRLSHTQNTLLAQVYERLGAQLRPLGLPAHAVQSFGRAATLHRLNEDMDAVDRCGLQQARARCQTKPRGLPRVGSLLSDLLCGYGYKPFRLLGWIAVQLAVFSVALDLLSQESLGDTLYLSMTSYLNPMGLGDTERLADGGQALLATESWVGTVSLSVFFALLVRRWFRL